MTTCTGIKKMGRPFKPVAERNVAFCVSLPVPLIDGLEECARGCGQSRSAFVRRVLERYLKDFRASADSSGASAKGKA